ncbi:MAG TPA: HAD family phosphatase [Streptosporangiaceae bacterium]
MQEAGDPVTPGGIRGPGGYQGVIIDWGGVMTGPVMDSVRVWLDAERIDLDTYRAALRPWVHAAYDGAGDGNPIHALERGESTSAEFERELAARLVSRDGGTVAAEGLLARMFAATVPCEPMYAAVRALRAAGLRTCLLSNSWGSDGYPREILPELFDTVVISAEVGMRKPEERIFRHAVDLIGLAPGECVFVDDMTANVQAAEALGMRGVLHGEPAATVAQLADMFGLPLA